MILKVRVVPRNALRLGVVVRAQVPFSDAEDFKTRPVVVVSATRYTVQVLRCTTSPRRFQRPGGYHEIVGLVEAGLNRASGVEQTYVTIDRSDVLEVIGELGASDMAGVGLLATTTKLAA